jgi:hypothetical protein
MYLGDFSICGMHFPGSHPWGAFGWEVLAFVSISLLNPYSLARSCSRICCGGSNVGRFALVPDLSLAVMVLYEGGFPPSSALMVAGQSWCRPALDLCCYVAAADPGLIRQWLAWA